MAIDDVQVIDGVGIDRERKAICLLLTDHLAWKGDDSLNEYDHLILLQEKINAYISYLESKQYEEQYPSEVFDMAVIEIHFKYDITDNCEKFLNTVQSQVGQYGIKIEAHID
ncbi:MAG: branched-chain amino acid ABC transporter substrate-binding protein [Lachnospiraceae bacterium]|nr:branched-chain amino acid ABC transporter substrate-binding protein [Lachnospiraceae bacterium]